MSAPRLELLVATRAHFDAALAGPAELARDLAANVADDWERFPEAVPHVRSSLAESPAGNPWGPHLFLLRDPRTLVGWGGFKGAPVDRTVEIGYSVSPAFEGRGIATEAVALMVGKAAASGDVDVVAANTLPESGGSTRVLERSGFVRDAEPADEDGRVVWSWRYILPT